MREMAINSFISLLLWITMTLGWIHSGSIRQGDPAGPELNSIRHAIKQSQEIQADINDPDGDDSPPRQAILVIAMGVSAPPSSAIRSRHDGC